LKLKLFLQEEAFKLFLSLFRRGFNSGSKLQYLCIICLYIICRREKTSHLLIDFSDITQIQVNKIGTFFLKFIKISNIKIPILDPSLFIHRFVSHLGFKNKTPTITKSSLRLIARMKREWMATGRRPNGLCGAAILLAAKMHGIQKTQKEISDVVRIGNIALKMRLKEINMTSISNMTINEIDSGGGDDGNGSSILDLFKDKIFYPSSFDKICDSKKTKKLYSYKKNNFCNFDSKILKFDLKKKLIRQFIKKNEFFSLSKQKSKLIFGFNFKTVYKKDDFSFYLNSNYEILIKKNIWNEINAKYFFANSIGIRAQKEKPFAYFKMEFARK
jgi:transcription factor IIIB subunit 2